MRTSAQKRFQSHEYIHARNKHIRKTGRTCLRRRHESHCHALTPRICVRALLEGPRTGERHTSTSAHQVWLISIPVYAYSCAYILTCARTLCPRANMFVIVCIHTYAHVHTCAYSRGYTHARMHTYPYSHAYTLTPISTYRLVHVRTLTHAQK